MPSRSQYFFATGWPLYSLLLVSMFVGGILAGVSCEPSPAAMVQWQFDLLLSISMLVGMLVGLLAGLILATPILGPLYYHLGLKNGAPFQEGDRVRVLIGPHRDEIACVYTVWEERNQVRVDIGKQARREYKDVFGYAQVCREVIDVPPPALENMTESRTHPPES